jgi:hypothetical protein
MPMALWFANRRLKIAYWDQDAKFANAAKLSLEHGLAKIADVAWNELRSLDDIGDADLLIVAAHTVPPTVFNDWLRGLSKRMQTPSRIWIPALIVAPIRFDQFADSVLEHTMNNWYFDIIDPAHLDSIPVRVAHLVRIHDHLKELLRYQAELSDLEQRIDALEKKQRESERPS